MAINGFKGPVQVANDLGTREQPVETSRYFFNAPGTGLPEAFGSLSSDFSAMGSQISRMADVAAQREGAAAGQQAGMDPEFRPMQNNTIRGDAYDQAGLNIAGAQQKLAVRNAFDQVYQKHSADPAALANALKDTGDGFRSATISQLRPELEQEISSSGLMYMREATRAHEANTLAAQQAAMQSQITDGVRSVQQKAYSLGLDPAADKALAGDMASITHSLTAIDPRGNPLMDPRQAAKLLDNAQQGVATARIQGAFDRLPDVAAKEKFLSGLDEQWGNGEGLLKGYDLQEFHGLRGQLVSSLHADLAQQNVAKRDLLGQVQDVQSRVEAGHTVPPAEMTTLAGQVTALGIPEVDQAWSQARGAIQFAQTARQATPQGLEAQLQASHEADASGGTSGPQAHLLDMGDKILKTMTSELAKDPLGWAGRVGAAQVPPLDPKNLLASLKSRASVGDYVASYYHTDPTYLRPEEAQALAATASQGGAPLMQISTALVQGLGGPKALSALGQLGKYAPEAATIGGLLATGGDELFAKDAADGVAFRQNSKFKPTLKPGDAERAAANLFGGSLGEMGGTQSAIIETANAAYEMRAFRAGTSSFDPAMYDKALREASGETVVNNVTMGGLTFRNGSKVVVPSSIPQGTFNSLIDGVTDADIEGHAPVDPNGKPMTSRGLRGGYLTTVDDGKYAVSLNDPQSTDPHLVQWLKAAKDRPGDGDAQGRWIFDVKSLLAGENGARRKAEADAAALAGTDMSRAAGSL